MAFRTFRVATLLGLLLAISARAAWNVSSSETEKSATSGIEHRRIRLTDTVTSDEATLELALFSPKFARLRVVDNPNGEAELAAIMRRLRGIAGVNGGYFDPQNTPVGLLLSDAKLIAPLRKARLLSGVLVVAKDGSVAPRPVTLGPLIDGLRVVRSGLTGGDRVIISGTQMAMPGTKVQVRSGKIVPQAIAAAPDSVPVPLSGEATFASR